VTLRLPSAVTVGLAAAGAVVLGRRLGTARTGLLSGIVVALLPRVTWMGTEGRSAAFATAAAVWLTVLLVAAVRRNGLGWWAAYAVAGALAVVLWMFLALLVVAHGLAIVWSRVPRAVVVRWLVAALAAAVAVAPFLLRVRGQSAQVGWIREPGSGVLKQVAVDQWFGTDGWPSLPLAAACWLALVAVVVALARSGGLRPRGRDLTLATVALPWLVLPTVALIAWSVVATPVYVPKYVAFCVPAVALLLGWGIAMLPDRRWRVAAVVVLALLAVPAYVSERQPAAKDRSDWGSVADVVARDRQDGDAVLFGDLDGDDGRVRAPARAIAVAYPAELGGLRDVTLGARAGALGTLWDASVPLGSVRDELADVDRLWVVQDHDRPVAGEAGSDGALLDELGFTTARTWPGAETDVLLLTHDA
jgi:mannosyltransferase